MLESREKVLLVGFYNTKALGVRYLENSLRMAGYDADIVFFKNFNSANPKDATEGELSILSELARDNGYKLIGLSVMSSMYWSTVTRVADSLRRYTSAPIVCGGAFASLCPDKCLEFSDFVVRGEGEGALPELLTAVLAGGGPKAYAEIANLVYRSEDGQIAANKLRPLITDLDACGIPGIGGSNKYAIENGELIPGDPQIRALNYEIIASRGCPFTCSYCCSINLSRMNKGGGRYVRFRDPDKVIDELVMAKKNIKKMFVVHFWDEVFSNDEEWIDRFVSRYKREIGLPFEIWGHPMTTGAKLMKKLRDAGLYKVVMGIQSGSPFIRKEIFNRREPQDRIIEASRVLAGAGVPQVIYDFMLGHPFETAETIRETFGLCLDLAPPFELQLHGLKFFPATDIVDKALEAGLVDKDEMERMMYAPLAEQYDVFWKNEKQAGEIDFWYNLIYLTQFRALRKKAEKIAEAGYSPEASGRLRKLVKSGERRSKIRYYVNKGRIVAKLY